MSDTEFTVEPRDIPEELTPGYDHATYPPAPVHFDPIDSWDAIGQRLDPETIRLLAGRATVGEPATWHDTELGGE